ncbi:uncharacterized protein LOC130735994 [Lotus japonicus]|uniref:uncharacterized protein LOC130735994 n=1 Tax=Lotus japonicus TaxID=34305 RepID=UPI00258B99C7|nr:uncharacterized protein LOC130735994 [Lotus japonicus]
MVEADRMRYYRTIQPKLRVERYKGLHECLVRGETNAAATGQRIILPGSFTGGPRYMFNNCKDSFAICRYIGYPSLFITMTCNPEWPEVKRFVETRGLKPEDRPDILCRVFKMKLDELIDDLKSGKVFGKISGYSITIEFQKRGLPHAHILVFVHAKFKPKTPEDIDKVISAEIPDRTNNPELFEAVQKYMIHGPCGVLNLKSPCMNNGKCSKFFPKEFRTRTIIDDEGFPKYRRREDGRTVKKGKTVLDNRYVVPYNPLLLQKYRAHINVEYTCQTSAIKYLFKYVHKGNDRVTAEFYRTSDSSNPSQVIDEIKNYYDYRYISACEAAWRLFGFEVHYREPPVVRLPFHLPGEQSVVYNDGETVQDAIEKADIKKNKFIGWMEANQLYAAGQDITYSEYPTKFVWKDDTREWRPRKQGFSIGRISHVPPSCGENYYLRILLNVQKGCTSFKDILTVKEVTYSTFKDACCALGLLEDDKEFVDAIKEASFWGSGEYLRRLFVVLLMSNNMSNPEVVWDKCWQELSDDILYRQRRRLDYPGLNLTDDQKKNMALAEIENMLQNNGRSLHNFVSMPYPSDIVVEDVGQRLIVEELNYDRNEMSEYLDQCLSSITDEQRHAYDKIINAVYGNKGGFFFLYGYGGTGKTFVWKTLSASIRSRGDIVLNVASSGIAALLLPRGRTAHSRFKIPIPITEDSTCNIKHNIPHAKLLIKAKLIIWDEAPMMSKWCYEALDKCLRDILRFTPGYDSSLPFGGKVVVLGGDFRKILPVIRRASRQDVISDGKVGQPVNGESEIQIPDEILIKNSETGFEDLVNFTYPYLLRNMSNSEYFRERSILAPTIELVGKVNDYMMSRVSAEEREYLSSDSIYKEDGNVESELDAFSPEVLNAMNCSGLPPHKLSLKIGVPVILMRNIDQSNGLCNGTRLTVKRFGDHVIQCTVLTGTKAGSTVLIPRMTMNTNNTNLPFQFQRRQLPICVCFGMTINKAQGQTLGCVGLYLPRPVFSHGQLYVALSRVKSKQGLRILIENHDDLPSNTTINAVYEEVFDNITP